MLACYTNVLSCHPGDVVNLFASSSTKCACRLEVARIGKSRDLVLTKEQIAVQPQEIPDHADMLGCDWPACASFMIGDDWRSGYYDLKLCGPSGEEANHFVCVKPARGKRGSKAALVLSTNTYHAYNWWGGANAYCNVSALMSRTQTLAQAMEGSIGVLSTQRPFSPLIVAAPEDTPRLVNLRPREFLERPWASSPEWSREHRASPYDRSAGFLHKWEHAFVAWAEKNRIVLDYFTDRDIDAEDGIIDDYRAIIVVGHSEYWSGPSTRPNRTLRQEWRQSCCIRRKYRILEGPLGAEWRRAHLP